MRTDKRNNKNYLSESLKSYIIKRKDSLPFLYYDVCKTDR